jgi:hypothetical protein
MDLSDLSVMSTVYRENHSDFIKNLVFLGLVYYESDFII